MNKLAFGCSHTFGIGVNPEDAWPAKLDAINYGVPGCSTDLIAHTCEEKIHDHEAEVVYAFWPDWTRFEFNGTQILPNSNPELYKNRSDEWLKQNRENKIVEIETICARNNCLLVGLYMEDLFGILDHSDKWPAANDDSHFGAAWHIWLADLFRIRESFLKYEQAR